MRYILGYYILYSIYTRDMMDCVLTSSEIDLGLQCGKPFFSNTRQNGEWTETITRQDEKELAMFDESHFF